MIRLKDAHRGDRALVICGGPSLVAHGVNFSSLPRQGCVTFVDAKALTPHLLKSGFVPDYYLMLFPEKAKDNAFQSFVYRSILADRRIDPYVKPAQRAEARAIRERFHEYCEPWRPERGAHKRFRWRADAYLPGSPYDLLARVPQARIIANRSLLCQYFPSSAYGDRTFYYEQTSPGSAFDVDEYFAPREHDGTLHVQSGDTFLNSAAIALYPLLAYMGFREAYFLGMDMSMLGSLEYAAPYTFRSMAHFWWFFRRTRHVFNANFRPNRRFFMRPESEFDDLRRLWRAAPITFTRVYDAWRYATPVDGIRTIGLREFHWL